MKAFPVLKNSKQGIKTCMQKKDCCAGPWEISAKKK